MSKPLFTALLLATAFPVAALAAYVAAGGLLNVPAPLPTEGGG